MNETENQFLKAFKQGALKHEDEYNVQIVRLNTDKKIIGLMATIKGKTKRKL